MKSTFLLFFFAFMSVALFAQNGIGFQGIARDPQGNAIANKDIEVKFIIGSFTETQKIKSDQFGVFSATIGSVNTVGFNNLDFANNPANLKVEVDGTAIYDDKFNTVPYAKAAENGVPAGAIMPYAGSVTGGNGLLEPIPGWLVCNGATLTSDAKYDKIKTVLGTLWETNKLPDLRGVFLRGVNNGRTGAYADFDNRTVGSFQADENKEHNHTGTALSAGAHTHTTQVPDTKRGVAAVLNDDGDYYRWNYTGAVASSSAGAHNHNLSIANSGTESRPKNAAIVYIIKY
jgi:microcystin-dependent protein